MSKPDYQSRLTKLGIPAYGYKTPAEARAMRATGLCSYPQCTCIVSTSSSRPVPRCPLRLDYAGAGLWKTTS